MNWKNLQNNICPKCDKDFILNLTTYPIKDTQMLGHGCGFTITEKEYTKLVATQITDEIASRLDKKYE